MQKHTKIYMDYFGYGEQSFMPCECDGSRAVDVHHIIPRGRGGSKKRDYIENLIGLCRNCHDRAEFRKRPYLTRLELQSIHNRFIKRHNSDQTSLF